ncbi:hypothetical protein CWS31_016640 [Colwellia echini]|uniref:Uncharacterized protein n=1 Tax=Colwellia echini TaxID=1982103 RepID=A0ABY3MST5_9GAMM|nr:hypothetical protein CWS31_016640 [Colwellia echini]
MLSIPIASYCSIKRLALEYLSSLKMDHLINPIGIITQYGNAAANITGNVFINVNSKSKR